MADFTKPRVSEKKFFAIPNRLLTANGAVSGLITVDSTYPYKVGQIVSLSSSSQQSRRLKIKRIISETEMYVGDPGTNITQYADMSAFLTSEAAVVALAEQQRPVIDILEIQRQVYEEEPTMALRSHMVDWLGRSYDKSNPMPVQLSDGSVNIGTVNAELEVFLTHKDNDPDVGDVASSVRIGDGVEELAINPDGSINANIDGAVIPLPVGAATEAKQDVGNASLDSIDDKLDILPDLATSALQNDGNTSLDSIDNKLDSLATASGQDTSNVILDDISTKIDSLATEAKQDIGNASLDSIDDKLDTLSTLATSAKQDISNASLASVDSKLNSLATSAKQDTGNASLTSIDSKLDNLSIEAMTEATNPDNIMIVGTLNGQKNSTKYGFVNNVRQQVIASHDRQQVITYNDFGNKDQRITKVEYTSPTFPGITVTKNIAYSLVGNKYRRDSINWVIS